MILIFGGAYQGKLDAAIKIYGVTERDCFDCIDDVDFSYRVLNKFDKYILHLVEKGADPTECITKNITDYRDKIIIVTDISSGVVPVSPLMRKWREEVGRCMAAFTESADEVYRVFCGIATKLK